MPGIKPLVQLISLDVCARLVASGRVQRALAITGASNATPIVVSTSTPHGIPLPEAVPSNAGHVVVSGVGGNTAANTAAGERAWLAVALSDTTLALYEVADDGTVSALAGDGDYTSGGTLSIALTDAKILLGRVHTFELSAPPRIVFIPMRVPYGPKSVYNRSVVAGAPSAEMTRQRQQRSIRSADVSFEVHVWGQATPADPENDFDETQVLEHAVIQSVHDMTAGTYDLSTGMWADQEESATQELQAGHEFVFGVSFGTPILGELLELAPSDVSADPTTNLLLPGSSVAEVGCSG